MDEAESAPPQLRLGECPAQRLVGAGRTVDSDDNHRLRRGRVPDAGPVAAVLRPISQGKAHAEARTPLVAALSFDGGRTWPARRLVEGDPAFNYHYCAIAFVDDAVLLGYSLNRIGSAHQGNLRLRRLALSWLPVGPP